MCARKPIVQVFFLLSLYTLSLIATQTCPQPPPPAIKIALRQLHTQHLLAKDLSGKRRNAATDDSAKSK